MSRIFNTLCTSPFSTNSVNTRHLHVNSTRSFTRVITAQQSPLKKIIALCILWIILSRRGNQEIHTQRQWSLMPSFFYKDTPPLLMHCVISMMPFPCCSYSQRCLLTTRSSPVWSMIVNDWLPNSKPMSWSLVVWEKCFSPSRVFIIKQRLRVKPLLGLFLINSLKRYVSIDRCMYHTLLIQWRLDPYGCWFPCHAYLPRILHYSDGFRQLSIVQWAQHELST